MGTYMHGILDNTKFVDWILSPYLEKCARKEFDYSAYKEEQYNKLADVIRANVDMDKLYKILESND